MNPKDEMKKILLIGLFIFLSTSVKAQSLDTLTVNLSNGREVILFPDGKWMFKEKDIQQKDTSLVALKKGKLLNLALENKDELKKQKSYIDDVFQFMVDNTILTTEEPQIRHKGEQADLLINLTWRIDKLDDLLKRLSLFYENPYTNSMNGIIVLSPYNFKSINAEALSEYYQSKTPRIEIKAGKWQTFTDIINTLGIETKGSETLTIRDIPVNDLTDITSIDTKIIITKSQREDALKKLQEIEKMIKH